MSVDDKTRYGRVCLLVLNACPVGLRRFIEHNYTTNGFARFDGFLDQWNIKHNLFHLRFKSCCSVHCTNANRSTPICTEQWDLLYKETLSRNPHGDGRKCPCMYTAIPGVTTEVMDVTLCCLLLRNCMSGGINMVHIEEICAVRNQILHSNSATLDEQTFNDIWRRLDKSLLHIAAQVSSEFHNEVRKTIKETKTSFCDNSREELVAARKMHDDLKNKTDLTLSQIRELFAEDDKETSQEQREKDNYSRLMQAVHGTGRAMMRDMRETLVNRASIENLEHLGQQTESQTPGNVPDMVSDDLQISTMNKMFAEYLKDDSVNMKNKFMLPTAKSEHFKSKESISFIEDIKTICSLDIFVKNNTAKSLKEHEYTEKWAQLMEVAERRGGVYVRSLSDLETRNIKLWNWKKLEQILGKTE